MVHIYSLLVMNVFSSNGFIEKVNRHFVLDLVHRFFMLIHRMIKLFVSQLIQITVWDDLSSSFFYFIFNFSAIHLIGSNLSILQTIGGINQMFLPQQASLPAGKTLRLSFFGKFDWILKEFMCLHDNKRWLWIVENLVIFNLCRLKMENYFIM